MRERKRERQRAYVCADVRLCESEREWERKMYNTSLPSHERKKHLSVGLSER